MREFLDENGNRWQVLALDAIVAHGKMGAVLAFRPAAGEGARAEVEPVRGSITFNSRKAADFAIRTLGENELRRRLDMARAGTGMA